jgi:serine/threonine-protein kinase
VRQDHEAFDLLRREATVAMSLAHESIVKLHNLEVSGGRLFLVMEYVDGENFRQILQRLKRLSLRTVVSLTRACAAALGYAHGKGVLHRDLKPENLMLTRDQRLKIVDFGIAWPIHTGLRPETQYAEGTPGYMSPEEIRGLPLDARSDLFSLGAIVYELLSGGPVFPVGSHVDWILQITPQPPAGVPGDVAAVIMRALAREPGDRWPDVNTFAEALAQAAGPHLPAARPRRITPE